jgi:serine/threonine protein kinase
MTTATLPLAWTGRSGRQYVPIEGTKARRGGMATVRKVAGRGGPVGTSVSADGVQLALKLWNEGDEASLDQLQREAAVLLSITGSAGELPCPRLYDVIGEPLVTGLVMEWCPADLGRWWGDRLDQPDAFGRLMATMAEVARRVADYHEFFADRQAQAAHGDLKPSNILLSADGRWLISDFGTAQVALPGDGAWDETRAVVATENFLAPEVLFNARKRHPAAIDTWSLGASVFALLRLRRMAADGAEIPRNGTHSPRFRTERMNQVHQVYAKDPKRFRERDLDPSAFKDPLRMPEEDRRSVRDAMNGLLPTAAAEDALAEALLEVLDRALSIDPAHRFTSCRDLAAAFENLTRTYIQLAATDDSPVPPSLRETTDQIVRDRDAEVIRAERLARENIKLQAKIAALSLRPEVTDAPPAPAVVSRWASLPVGVGLALVVALQLVNLLLLGIVLIVLGLG